MSRGRKDNPTSSTSLGFELRRLRHKAGISLTTMAERVHYTKSHLSNVENGTKQPSHRLVEAYERVLGVSISDPAPRQRVLPSQATTPTDSPHTQEKKSAGFDSYAYAYDFRTDPKNYPTIYRAMFDGLTLNMLLELFARDQNGHYGLLERYVSSIIAANKLDKLFPAPISVESAVPVIAAEIYMVLPRYRGEGLFSHFATAITRRICLQNSLQITQSPLIELDPSERIAAMARNDPTNTIENPVTLDRGWYEQMYPRFRRIIARMERRKQELTPDQRAGHAPILPFDAQLQLFIDCKINGYSYAELAQQSNLPEETVKHVINELRRRFEYAIRRDYEQNQTNQPISSDQRPIWHRLFEDEPDTNNEVTPESPKS